MRTLSQILIQADEAKSVVVLKLLADEIMKNKHKMPLCEIIFGLEHIKDLAYRIKQVDEIKQLMS